MLSTLLLALAVTGQTRHYDLLASPHPVQAPARPERAAPAARPARMIDGERQPTMTYDPGPVVRQVAEPPPDETPLALDRPAQAAPVLSFQSTQATSCYSSSYQAAPSAQAAPATSCYSSSYSAAAPVVTYRAVPATTYADPVVTQSGPVTTYTMALPSADYATAAPATYAATTRRGLFGFRQRVRSSGVPITYSSGGLFSSGAVCTSGNCP